MKQRIVIDVETEPIDDTDFETTLHARIYEVIESMMGTTWDDIFDEKLSELLMDNHEFPDVKDDYTLGDLGIRSIRIKQEELGGAE